MVEQQALGVSRALAHEYVALDRVGERILVRCCRTTVRELDLLNGRSVPAALKWRDFVWPNFSPLEHGVAYREDYEGKGRCPLPSNSLPPKRTVSTMS